MAAFVKSVEPITTTFTASTGSLQTNTVNLTKSQDETQCVPFYTLRYTGAASDAVADRCVSIEMIDNSGTPAARIRRQGYSLGSGPITVEITIVEFGSNVTVQQGTVTITGTSATDSVTSVTQANSFVAFTQHSTSNTSVDDFNDLCIQASFNSDTQIAFERRASGNPDWEIYWYVVESDGTDFLTEYVEDSWTSSEQGPTNLTLSNSVTLVNAFCVATYETSETADDIRDGVCNVALTGTTTLTWYRNHGTSPSATGTIGVWVVRASATELDVQRFATDVDGQLTTNQSITTVDDTKALVLNNQNVGYGGAHAIDSTTAGGNVDDRLHAVWLQATDNVRLQRQADTTIDGSNNNIRFEVIEFELEGAAPSATFPGWVQSKGGWW